VAWRAASLEGLDDEHAAATARARRASTCASAGSISTFSSATGAAIPRTSRARAIVSARFALANKPQWRMRWKPLAERE